MNAGLQTSLVLLLVALALAYLVRGLAKSARGKGCASGCGSCSSSTCTLRKLEEKVTSGDAPR
jgi:hypothetical protein